MRGRIARGSGAFAPMPRGDRATVLRGDVERPRSSTTCQPRLAAWNGSGACVIATSTRLWSSNRSSRGPPRPRRRDVGIARRVPAPALEGHDDGALVGVVARDHAPALVAQLLACGELWARRDLLRAAADRRGDDDQIAVRPRIGAEHFRPYGIGEIGFPGQQGSERDAMPLVRDQCCVQSLLAQVTALDGSKDGRSRPPCCQAESGFSLSSPPCLETGTDWRATNAHDRVSSWSIKIIL